MILDMESTGEVVRSTTTTSNGGGITVVGSDAPSDFHIAPRSESSNPSPNSVTPLLPQSHHTNQLAVVAPPPQISTATTTTMMEGISGGPVKKKRGRPRKYGPDGAVMALSPKPISSAPAPSHPPASSHVIDFSASEKRGKMKPTNSFNRTKPHHQVENLGEWVPCSVGGNFTPHIITVNAGEDVTMKVISFSQQGPRAICVLSANGVISSVTLRQPDSSGGTLTYEGRFEILSLSGSFMPNDIGGTRSRTGGMSVSLASPDGRVVGGGVAGLLVAASPVQVVVGSFLAGKDQEDQKPKKNKHDFMLSAPTAAIPISSAADHRTIHSVSSLPISNNTWQTSLASDPRNKSSDINGRFEILSLSGSFMPNDIGGTRSRTGGMSVSLASPDGRVVGGGVAGLLVAASPVQVVVGSFLAGKDQEDQKPKKNKHDFMLSAPTAAIPISSAADHRTIHSASSLPISNNTWQTSLASDPRNKSSDINVSLT